MKAPVLSTVIFLLFSSLSLAQSGDLIIGSYHLPNQLDIEIFKSEGKYFGKIIGLNGYNEGQEMDIYNPDKSKHRDPLMGKTIIKNLEYDETEHQWLGGSMYGPEKGLVFNLKVARIEEDQMEVVASKFLFWKTLNWEKL